MISFSCFQYCCMALFVVSNVDVQHNNMYAYYICVHVPGSCFSVYITYMQYMYVIKIKSHKNKKIIQSKNNNLDKGYVLYTVFHYNIIVYMYESYVYKALKNKPSLWCIVNVMNEYQHVQLQLYMYYIFCQKMYLYLC